MSLIERAGLALLHRMDPEKAHGLALRALRSGLAPLPGVVRSDRLRVRIGTLDLPNPIGLAAGFDKNAEAVSALGNSGFGFIEVGAATPLPQPGNPRPRLFRLPQDRAVINRFGFNNDGAEAIARRLAAQPCDVPLGLNLGANKDSADRAGDYVKVLECCGALVDFVTVNVSSPNTEKLRDLQGPAALRALLARVAEANAALAEPVPVFLKIAPDLDNSELDEIAAVAEEAALDAIVATNTTLTRDGLTSPHGDEKGGLSGAPLFDISTRVLAKLAARTKLPLIGVGGIGSAEDAYIKIKAGASAVQLYSALVYEGIGLAARIATGLDTLLEQDGHASVADAVGLETARWT
ncbi:quinone-dependent dihydroorotate dehydrogenase [Aestuariibius sp. 2305UL40-4]|uniref:quinone-dependent dihydroorotate dehydrogenase n=1 Tax=Aestuariibius violaceus TaxID=3234132 RepID=UPI00345E0A5A